MGQFSYYKLIIHMNFAVIFSLRSTSRSRLRSRLWSKVTVYVTVYVTLFNKINKLSYFKERRKWCLKGKSNFKACSWNKLILVVIILEFGTPPTVRVRDTFSVNIFSSHFARGRSLLNSELSS